MSDVLFEPWTEVSPNNFVSDASDWTPEMKRGNLPGVRDMCVNFLKWVPMLNRDNDIAWWDAYWQGADVKYSFRVYND